MNTYEYRPNPPKKKEKKLVAFFVCFGSLLFAASYIPNVFLPWLFQVLSVGALGCGIYFSSRYLLRTFHYRLESGTVADGLDFVIVEQTGKRLQTVCRISVTDVEKVEQVTKENRKEILGKTQKNCLFCYQAQMEPTDHYLITAVENEVRIYLLISADQRLIDGILSH